MHELALSFPAKYVDERWQKYIPVILEQSVWFCEPGTRADTSASTFVYIQCHEALSRGPFTKSTAEAGAIELHKRINIASGAVFRSTKGEQRELKGRGRTMTYFLEKGHNER